MAVNTTGKIPFLLLPNASVGAYVDGSAERYLAGHNILLHGSDRENAIARKSFLEREVELLWDVRNEILIPSETEQQVVYVGHLKNLSSDLMLRISGEGIALARAIATGPLQNEEARWFYAWYGERKNAFITQGTPPLNEIVKAVGLATEFTEAVEAYMPQYL